MNDSILAKLEAVRLMNPIAFDDVGTVTMLRDLCIEAHKVIDRCRDALIEISCGKGFPGMARYQQTLTMDGMQQIAHEALVVIEGIR